MSAASWINRNIYGGEVKGPTGGVPAGTPPPSQARLVPNPDGTATDPATGQTYARNPDGVYGAAGMPDSSQLISSAANRAGGFYNQVPGYDQREQTAYNAEGNLADSLNRTAQGIGPTVAGNQLQIGLDQAGRQQLAQAAGASGNNAALSRVAAMNNTAQLQSQTNQATALARAQEAANAQNALGTVTGNMVNQSQAESGQKIGAGQALTNIATNADINRESEAEKANKDEADNNKSSMTSALNGGSSLVTSLASLL